MSLNSPSKSSTPPPSAPNVSLVDARVLDELVAAARAHPRRRMNKNLHAMEDPIHRLLNAMEPDSYVVPHRHLTPPKHETIVAVRGRFAVLLFDDGGRVTHRIVLAPSGATSAVELPAGTWHSLLALESGSVFFEVKAGPYVAPVPSDVATWAPPPADSGAAKEWLARMAAALAG
jgi:cupin fold WbuC family metalloprotein